MRAKRSIKILITAFVIAISTAIYFAPMFTLQKINFSLHDSSIEADKVLSISDISLGQNLNSLMLSRGNIITNRVVKAELSLMEDISIKNVRIERTSFSGLDIEIESRKPVMYTIFEDYLIYFDYDGTVIDSAYEKNVSALKISGFDTDFFYFGRDLSSCIDNFEMLSIMCRQLDSYDIYNHTAVRTLITDISILEDGNAVVNYDNRINVYINLLQNIEYDTDLMCSILTSIGKSKQGTIDFTSGGHPFFTPAN